jgi:hypothetical protein
MHPWLIDALQNGVFPRLRILIHGILGIKVHHIDSEPIDPLIQPELNSILIDGPPRRGILPIQIRLLGGK